MVTKEITLASGRVVTIRRPSAAAFRRVYGHLPALESLSKRKDSGEDLQQGEMISATEAFDQVISACSFKPRFWIDPRPEQDQQLMPRDPPEGWESIEVLDFDEAFDLAAECLRLLSAAKEETAASPLAATNG